MLVSEPIHRCEKLACAPPPPADVAYGLATASRAVAMGAVFAVGILLKADKASFTAPLDRWVEAGQRQAWWGAASAAVAFFGGQVRAAS